MADRRFISSVLSALFGVALSGVAGEAAASPLSDLASTLTPGSFAELKALGMGDEFTMTGGSSGNTLGYAESLKWDPVTGQLFYIGMDHNQTDGTRFLIYSEAT